MVQTLAQAMQAPQEMQTQLQAQPMVLMLGQQMLPTVAPQQLQTWLQAQPVGQTLAQQVLYLAQLQVL